VSRVPEYYLTYPNGISNLTSAELWDKGAAVPIFVSQPYFFGADDFYTEQVKLPIKPNVTMHNTFVFVDPITGVTLKALKRLQVSLLVRDSLLYPNMVDGLLIPVAWFELSGVMDEPLTKHWHDSLDVPLKIKFWSPIAAYTLSAVLGMLALVMFIMGYMRKDRNSYSSIETDHNIQGRKNFS